MHQTIPHMLYSLSKSFTSSAVGLAVEEGLLSIDDTVLSFFPDEAPETVSENLAAMRVRHLLSMNTGHAEDTTQHLRESVDPNWARDVSGSAGGVRAGHAISCTTAARTYMLSAIVQKLTGQTLVEYLRPRLFEPLGIENPVWETCPRGINTGGWGLSHHDGGYRLLRPDVPAERCLEGAAHPARVVGDYGHVLPFRQQQQ